MRGLKPLRGNHTKSLNLVASFTDAWIETKNIEYHADIQCVASFTDAWIETFDRGHKQQHQTVASFTDAWIETIGEFKMMSTENKSHLLQMRGLKPFFYVYRYIYIRRIFYRCVD